MMPPDTSEPSRVVLRGLSRRFSAIKALDHVDIEILGGEIHALCGENGAGKSTLIQVLGGVIRPDAGTIEMDGRPARFRGPADALREGVGIIYQELNLVEAFSVAQNLALGHEPRVGPFLSRRAMERRAAELLADLQFDLHPRTLVSELTIGQRQQVEIAKALGRQVRVLILDEPTAALSRAETDRLFRILRRLRERGLAVLYVSHHLEEVFAITDRITVLRDGRRVGTWPTNELTMEGVVAAMVGEAVDIRQGPPRRATAPPLMRVSAAHGRILRGVDLEVRPGEVVGLTGLAGSGHEELSEALFGSVPLASGRIEWKGRPFRPRHPDDARRRGIAWVPPDRRRQGLIPALGITENLSLAGLRGLSIGGWLRQGRRRELAEEWCRQFEVGAASLSQRVDTLSGGNQQKVLLARWAALEPDLFVLNEPTRGIDVKTREAIHRWVERLAEAGRCVLLVSSDTQELIRLADRCLVFRNGRITARLEPPGLAEHALVAAMMEG
jgi:ABC-type sugar transport system ATPase subunit